MRLDAEQGNVRQRVLGERVSRVVEFHISRSDEVLQANLEMTRLFRSVFGGVSAGRSAQGEWVFSVV